MDVFTASPGTSRPALWRSKCGQRVTPIANGVDNGGQKITQIPVDNTYELIQLVRQCPPTRAVDLLLAESRLTLALMRQGQSSILDESAIFS